MICKIKDGGVLSAELTVIDNLELLLYDTKKDVMHVAS